MNFERLDFVKHRKKFYAFSLSIVIIGALMLSIFGLNLGVDFSAGTSLDITIGENTIDSAEAREMLEENLDLEPIITIGGESSNRVSARFDRVLTDQEREAIFDRFKDRFGEDVAHEENTVDPQIARELAFKAINAVLIASIGIIIYVAIRFEWRFGIASIIALLYDAFIVVSFFAIFRIEVNIPFVAAVLTVIGYSLNDSIIVFDRIRENLRFAKLKTYEDLAVLVNNSIRQTLVRTFNTTLTVLFVAAMLLVFGSEAISVFSIALLVGLTSGVYSTLFIAVQIWMALKFRSMQRLKEKPADPEPLV